MKKIIISRTDSIGDVILTLPVAGILKKHFPDCKISFLGRKYTRPLIEMCRFVDEFLDWETVSKNPHPFQGADAIIHVFPVKAICHAAKKAPIPIRIATSHRWFTWLTCNKLLHFNRKNSGLHEAQLNLKMLEPLGISEQIPLSEIHNYYGLSLPNSPLPLRGGEGGGAPSPSVILHPKSKGSAREWGLDNYSRLIALLPEERFTIYITGTKEDGESMKEFLEKNKKRIVDLTGKLTLPELILCIGQCNALVAASTGPLHIAAALGKKAIGLYAPMKPIHPGRWAPVGLDAHYLVLDKDCNKCRKTGDCECIRMILPEEVAEKLRS